MRRHAACGGRGKPDLAAGTPARMRVAQPGDGDRLGRLEEFTQVLGRVRGKAGRRAECPVVNRMAAIGQGVTGDEVAGRSEEHTSELQSL